MDIYNNKIIIKNMEALNASKILSVITARMYYDEMGKVNEKIDLISYNADSTVAKIKLKDGRSFKIIIEIQ
jgi:hypothetical protein